MGSSVAVGRCLAVIRRIGAGLICFFRGRLFLCVQVPHHLFPADVAGKNRIGRNNSFSPVVFCFSGCCAAGGMAYVCRRLFFPYGQMEYPFLSPYFYGGAGRLLYGAD